MKIIGLVRVKNGAQWMAECLNSMLAVCESVMVLDNASTDATMSICRDLQPRVLAIANPRGEVLNEAGDKNYLMQTARMAFNPDWVLMLDADEVLLDPENLLVNIHSGRSHAYRVRIWSCWNTPDMVRNDGIYGRCHRASVFRAGASNGKWVERSPNGPNLHCSNVPQDMLGHDVNCFPAVRVRHYGYMDRLVRIRKYHWYLDIDPEKLYYDGEDGYKHSVQGDLPEFPASATYRYGGPLQLIPFPNA